MHNRNTILIICFLMVITHVAIAQVADKIYPLAQYDNTYSGEKYDIHVSIQGNGIYTLWVGAMPFDSKDPEGGISISEDNYYQFINSIELAKLHYQDLVKWAQKEDVKSFNKVLNIYNYVNAYFLDDRNSDVRRNIPLKFEFKVRDFDGEIYYLLYVSTGSFVLKNNPLTKTKGYTLIFKSSAEIERFTQLISSDKINTIVENSDTSAVRAKMKREDRYRKIVARYPFVSHLSYGLKAGYSNMFGMNNVGFGNTEDYIANSATSNVSNNFYVGAFGRITLGNFLLQPELLYSTGKKDYSLSYMDGNMHPVEFGKSTNMSIFDIPVLFGYRLFNGKKNSFRLMAGPMFRFDIASSEPKVTFFRTNGSTLPTTLRQEIEPSKVGWQAGFELDIHSLTFGARFTSIGDMYHSYSTSGKLIDNVKANTIVFSVGYKLFQPMK